MNFSILLFKKNLYCDFGGRINIEGFINGNLFVFLLNGMILIWMVVFVFSGSFVDIEFFVVNIGLLCVDFGDIGFILYCIMLYLLFFFLIGL